MVGSRPPLSHASSAHSIAARVILGTAAVLFVALSHYSRTQIGDDSFIFFRYVDNLLAGHGPVWNVGERVEGFSSPLWLLILSLGRSLGADYFVFSRWAGWAAAAAGIYAVWLLARRLAATQVTSAVACLLATLVGTLHYWSPTGLETSLYVAVFGLTCAAIVRGRLVEWAVWTALLGLVRPEGLVMAPWSVICFALVHGRRVVDARALAIALTPVVAYVAFRLAYYGTLLPNTYYAKATGALGERLGQGLEYGFWIGLLLLGAGAGAIALWLRARRATRERALLGALAFTSALFGIAVMGGGDWMWGHRLTLPMILPLFAIAAALASRVARFSEAARATLLGFVLFMSINDDLPFADRLDYEDLFGFGAVGHALKSPARFLEWRFVRPLALVGRALAWQTMSPVHRMEGTMTDASADVASYVVSAYPKDTLVAVNHAGAVPYYTGMPAVDMTGLADAHIAREVKGGLHQKFDPAYVVARRPGVVVLNARVEPGKDGVWYHEGYWDGETALVRYPPFLEHYRPVPRYWKWSYRDQRDSYILLYERITP